MFWGYVLGAALMIAAGIVQAVLGIEAAKKNLEDVATPLSAEEAEGELASRPRAARTPTPRSSPPPRACRTRTSTRRSQAIVARAARRRRAQPRRAGARVNCRLWGPGRYRRALAAAMQRGEIRGTRRRNFVAS